MYNQKLNMGYNKIIKKTIVIIKSKVTKLYKYNKSNKIFLYNIFNINI